MVRSTILSASLSVALLLGAQTALAQPWSGILSTGRAIDWSAGLPATLPDGEMPPNPWTPPTRIACTSAQAGTTVPIPSGASEAAIQTALQNCAAAAHGLYLSLACNGSYSWTSSYFLHSANYTTLRGCGGSTPSVLNMTGSNSLLGFGTSYTSPGGGALSANPGAGATSVTIVGATGAPAVGNIAWFNQCDPGWTGAPGTTSNTCTTGAYSDPGGLFACGGTTLCNTNGTGSGGSGHNSQMQVVSITSVTPVTGSACPSSPCYSVGFTPGVYLPNWSTSASAALYWQAPSELALGVGLEDLTIHYQGGGVDGIEMAAAYGSWVKGVTFLGVAAYRGLFVKAQTLNSLIANNYAFGADPSSPAIQSPFVATESDSANLVINNIAEQGSIYEGAGSSSGDVFAYNYARDVNTDDYQGMFFEHNGDSSFPYFMLFEGNEANKWLDDDTWGTHALNTTFRNYLNCGDSPFVITGVAGSGIAVDSFARGDNAVGNAIGGPAAAGGSCTTYQGTALGSVFRLNQSGLDPLAQTSFLRWGNVSTVTQPSDTPADSGVRFAPAEIPAGLVGNAALFNNVVPDSQTVPCSFFLPGYSATTCTPHPNGGTGLSFWKACTAWTTFPTACATAQTPPFPFAGPDVSGGTHVGGYAYDNPAALAWANEPINTALQSSYTVTSSSWSGGTETLTLSSFITGTHNLGPFQMTGAANACTSGASFNPSTNNELLMTGGNGSTTIEYSLASDPGANACNATVKYPDVRYHDERAYESDSMTSPPPPVDAGTPDAPFADAAIPEADAMTGTDASEKTPGASSSSGCSCRMASEHDAPALAGALAGLALWGVRRSKSRIAVQPLVSTRSGFPDGRGRALRNTRLAPPSFRRAPSGCRGRPCASAARSRRVSSTSAPRDPECWPARTG
jgi:MYXO-CTERM domain-containing protein